MRWKKRGRKSLADALTTPVDEVLPDFPGNVEKMSLVAERSVVAREVEAVSDVARGKSNNGKSNTVESHCCWNKNDVKVQKKKGLCREESNVVDAPADGDVGVVDADAVSESTLFAKDTRVSALVRDCLYIHSPACRKRLMT